MNAEVRGKQRDLNSPPNPNNTFGVRPRQSAANPHEFIIEIETARAASHHPGGVLLLVTQQSYRPDRILTLPDPVSISNRPAPSPIVP
jgi:hypothetical protein